MALAYCIAVSKSVIPIQGIPGVHVNSLEANKRVQNNINTTVHSIIIISDGLCDLQASNVGGCVFL